MIRLLEDSRIALETEKRYEKIVENLKEGEDLYSILENDLHSYDLLIHHEKEESEEGCYPAWYKLDSFTEEQVEKLTEFCGKFNLSIEIDEEVGYLRFILKNYKLDLKEENLEKKLYYIINNLDIHEQVSFKISDFTPLDLAYALSNLVVDYKLNIITSTKEDLITVAC